MDADLDLLLTPAYVAADDLRHITSTSLLNVNNSVLSTASRASDHGDLL
jgi:hypothetical protein